MIIMMIMIMIYETWNNVMCSRSSSSSSSSSSSNSSGQVKVR